MKYRLIIADDEYFIRQKLKKIIEYEKLELELAGDYENGLQVIEFLKNNHADIVLLDIKMPKYSGLETAQYIHGHCPDTKVIILSGYNVFEYARTTLRSGVFDYLLKPVEPSALNSTLEKCIAAINEIQISNQKLNALMHYEKQLALTSVLRKSMTVEELCCSYPEFSPAVYCAFFSFYTDADSLSISRQLIKKFRENGITCEFFIESENIFYLQIFLTGEEELSLCEYLCKVWLKSAGCTCYYYLGNIFDIEDDWAVYLKEALDRLDHRFFSSRPDLSRYQVIPDENNAGEIRSVRQTLFPLLNASDVTGFKKYIHALFLTISSSKSYVYLHMMIVEIFSTFSVKYTGRTDYRTLHRDYVKERKGEETPLTRLEEHIINYSSLHLTNCH